MEQGVDYAIEKEINSQTKYSLCKDTILSWIHPVFLLGIGVLCLIGYMMTSQIYIRIVQVIVFFSLAIQIKRIKVLYFIMLTASITFFYLLVPQGKILYEWFFLKITEDALRDGLFRGVTLSGYVFLSLWCISPRLRFPSKYGILLTKSISFFSILVEVSSDSEFRKFVKEQKQKYRKHKMGIKGLLKQVVERIDVLLLESIREYTNNRVKNDGNGWSDIENNNDRDNEDKSVVLLLQRFRGVMSLLLVILCSWGGVVLKLQIFQGFNIGNF